MMNNYIKQTQYFLLQLIDLYSGISDLLKKIPIPNPSKSQTLLSLTETVTACNCIDRGIKRQHELRLFRETHSLISQYLQKPEKVKKIDIVIKFSLVSQVLSNRLKEQLITSQELKSKILSQIEQEKQQFLKWAEKKKEDKVIKQQKKQTDNYVVKFIFTDIKSSNQPLEHPNPQTTSQNTKENIFTRQPLTKRHLHKAITSSKMRNSSSRLTLQPTRRNADQRKTIGLERPTFPTPKRQQCTIPQKEQPSACQVASRDNLVTIVTPANNEIEAEENKQNSQLKFKKKSKYLTIDSTLIIKDSEGQEQNKQPISEYYVSHRYLKSKKTIESASHFSSKIKKRSGFNLTNDVAQCQSSRQQHLQQEEMIFRTTNFKPKQQTYPRFANQTKSFATNIKSQKMIANNHSEQQAHGHNKVLRRSQKLETKKGKRRSSLRSKTSMMSSDAKKESLPIKKSEFFNLSSLKIDGEASVPNDQRREEKSVESNIKAYYNELSCMRGDIMSSCDSWLKDFSVFFWHQTILSQEKNRSIQKILANRKCSYPIGQFDLRLQTSQRPISGSSPAHEDAFVHAMRSHLSECQELGQGGPRSD